jgi:hypothetical protein
MPVAPAQQSNELSPFSPAGSHDRCNAAGAYCPGLLWIIFPVTVAAAFEPIRS